jgi:hypothetical protein
LLTLASGPDHGDDLAPSCDEVGQQPGLLIRKRPRLKARRFGKMRNDRGIDRIGLGALADRLCEGSNLHWVDDGHWQSRSPRPAATTVSKPPVASNATICGESSRNRAASFSTPPFQGEAIPGDGFPENLTRLHQVLSVKHC